MKPSKKIYNKSETKGEFFMGVKIIEKELFGDEYSEVIREKNESKNPAIIVTCIFCQRSAIETAKGYICPKCGPKPFKGIDFKKGYFTCVCGLLVDNETKECQICKRINSPLRRIER